MFCQTILIVLISITYVQGADNNCEPIPPSLTSPKTGQKAWDKCVEYQELIYPCEESSTGQRSRSNYCKVNADEPTAGTSVVAAKNEFPHMALVVVGEGDGQMPINWLCGGALISDRFILTAAHCAPSNEYGLVTYVILGTVNGSDEVDDGNKYKIQNIFKHPEFVPPNKYNDIALLETERRIKLDQFRVPACLPIGDYLDKIAYDTSYDTKTYDEWSSVDAIRKTILTKYTTEKCSAKYRPERYMKQGFDNTTQICYGEKSLPKEYCRFDSSGPLQIRNKKLSCMYTIIGMSSFGAPCGYKGYPDVYTKLSYYLPWIESIVWL